MIQVDQGIGQRQRTGGGPRQRGRDTSGKAAHGGGAQGARGPASTGPGAPNCSSKRTGQSAVQLAGKQRVHRPARSPACGARIQQSSGLTCAIKRSSNMRARRPKPEEESSSAKES